MLPNTRVFDTKAGLSQSSVLDVVQDSLGYIWLATQDGLNRFDGYGFTAIKPGLEQNNTQQFYKALVVNGNTLYAGSWGGGLWALNLQTLQSEHLGLRNHDIRALVVDAHGSLWIATHGQGIYNLRPDGSFDNYLLLETGNINTLLFHPSGILFAGTDEGLFYYDSESSKFVLCSCYTGRTTGPRQNVNAIALYDDQTIWVATSKGLLLFDFVEQRLEEFNSSRNPEFADDDVLALCYENEQLWIGTNNGGLFTLSAQTNAFRQYDKTQSGLLSDVLSIQTDLEGNLLIGTLDSFLIHTPTQPFWRAISNDPKDKDSLPYNELWQLLLDHTGNLWMGTFNGGLVKQDSATGRYSTFRHNPADPNSIAGNSVYSIAEDYRGRIWIGTGAGLSVYDPVAKRFANYSPIPGDSRSLSADSIWCLFEDSQQRMWVGTSTGGLNLYNPEGDDFIRYPAEPGNLLSLQSNFVYTLYEDSAGTIWVGTIGGGLHRMNEDGSFANYRTEPNNFRSLPNDFVLFIDEYTPGSLWISTNGGGIALFDIDKEEFQVYQEQHGLPNNVVYCMLRDKNGLYWLSTNNGISVFNAETDEFRNFNLDDGLPWLEFNGKSYASTDDGLIYFGATSGLLEINSELLAKNNYEPIVRMQDLHINNIKIPVADASTNTMQIAYASQLILHPEDHQFSVEFSVSSYIAPEKNNYRYTLHGFDKDWIYPDDRRATYTNLPAGTFMLEVQGSNNDGVWSEEPALLEIVVIPIWYKNSVYQVLFVLFVLTLIMLLVFWRFRVIKQKNQALIMVISNLAHELNSPLGALSSATAIVDAELESILVSHTSELDDKKLDFSTIHSMFNVEDTKRRLKGSLNLEVEIMSILAQRLDVSVEKQHELAGILAMHGFRIEQFRDQLGLLSLQELDKLASVGGILSALAVNVDALRKVDNVITTLKVFTRTVSDKQFELIDLKQQLLSAIRNSEGKLGQLVDLQVDIEDGLYVFALRHQLELVWEALLSNAIDAALERSKAAVNLQAYRDDGKIIVHIGNNGHQIQFWRRRKIFRPFYTTKTEGAGRGLGLNVVMLILHIQDATLSLSSTKEKTIFTVSLTACRDEAPL